MQSFLLSQEMTIRFAFFGGLLALLAAWEVASPWRISALPRLIRWRTNLGLSLAGTLAVRIVAPAAAMGVAIWCEAREVGLFNQFAVPLFLSLPLSLLALDLLIYAQHAIFHHVPLFWRMHRVHHADPEIDVTTAVRFHPIEILVSMGIKMAAVAALGAPPVAVLVFEVTLNAMAMFNHSNVALPPRIERMLRRVIVTPDMHRIHHSVRGDEHNMNFGFNLSVWDRLFRTYCDAPCGGAENLRIGLDAYKGTEPTRLFWSLALPFLGGARPNEASGEQRRENA
ncbi:sterol desaturase family protein [Parvibaculum sp.]|uniref:sterol desaturase family protein n=1 Tax=Parvibaculum sp. TaxID=2024848 RepID=UPI00321181D0